MNLTSHVKVLLTMRDGSLTVMSFITRGAPNIDREPTPEAVQAEIDKTFPEQVASWRLFGNGEALPPRDYRNAWTDTGKAIEHDMGKAREIHRNKLREARAPRLAALDVEVMKALETKDDTKLVELVAQKQALRDAPADPRIDAAQTIEELRAVTLTAPASSDTRDPRPTSR